MVIILDVEAVHQPSVGGAILAVLATRGSIGVRDIAAVVINVCLKVG